MDREQARKIMRENAAACRFEWGVEEGTSEEEVEAAIQALEAVPHGSVLLDAEEVDLALGWCDTEDGKYGLSLEETALQARLTAAVDA